MATRRTFLARAGGLAAASGLVLGAAPDGDQDPVPEGAETPSPRSLVFETVFTDDLAHLSYLIGDQETGRAAVIDPRRDVDVYLDLAREKGVVITHAIETHNHADFVSGCRELAVRSGTARIYLSVEGGMEYDFDHEPLHDGDTIDLGRVLLTARHTPGHTPEHLAYLIAEARRPDRPFGVFSGDCLFADSVGRPDLAGDDRSRDLAGQLFRSIREVFLKLEDGVRVHPAHGAGSPCGSNIGDRLVTTIGYERRFNPALQMADEGKFAAFVLDTAPPEPTYYRRTRKVNARGPEVLGRLPTVRPLHPEEFRTVAEGDVQLVDNRQMLAFGGGHIEGAMNIGPRPELSIWAGWMLDPARPILLVLREESDLSRVVTQLVRVGFTQFAGYLLGGMEAWANAGMPMRSVPQITVQEVMATSGDLQILDVRTPEEWERGHVPHARYLFLPELPEKLGRLDRGRPLAVYCDSGYRASLGASILERKGFEVRNVPGSWSAWCAAGLPREKPDQDRPSSDTNRG